MQIEILTVIAGVIVILGLAEVIIKNSIQLSQHYGLSGTFVGLTVLSIGTSIPEIMTHIIGSVNILQHPGSMATLSSLLIGTNIGSDIFQQNFVLPAIGIIGTIVVVRKNLVSEMGALIGAALLVLVFSIGGVISRLEGAILLLAYVSYLIYLKKNKIGEQYKVKNRLSNSEVTLAVALVLFSFVIMAVVADRVLDASTLLVELLPFSASFFGVIILGVATALPELTTSLVAVFKRKEDISAGILIGSNITNPLLGIGLGALISEYTIPDVVVVYDLPFKIMTALLIYYFLAKSEDLTKNESISLIVVFLLYLIARNIFFPVDF